jgi:hypothetical protein
VGKGLFNTLVRIETGPAAFSLGRGELVTLNCDPHHSGVSGPILGLLCGRSIGRLDEEEPAMMPIFASWARMALLAVPFADPFLIGLVEAPEPGAPQADENGYDNATPEAAPPTPARPYLGCGARAS